MVQYQPRKEEPFGKEVDTNYMEGAGKGLAKPSFPEELCLSLQKPEKEQDGHDVVDL